MTVGNLIEKNSIIDDNTTIIIRCDTNFHVITSGNWYEDNILNYLNKEIEGFTWEKENIVYIDIIE
jgi:hypothetical protein